MNVLYVHRALMFCSSTHWETMFRISGVEFCKKMDNIIGTWTYPLPIKVEIGPEIGSDQPLIIGLVGQPQTIEQLRDG